jgi:hypothetical protein
MEARWEAIRGGHWTHAHITVSNRFMGSTGDQIFTRVTPEKWTA